MYNFATENGSEYMERIWTIGMILCGMLCSEASAQNSPLKFAQQSWDFGRIKEDGGKAVSYTHLTLPTNSRV